MKISFFSESQIRGKIPRDFSNARTEYAWMMALNAEHHPLGTNPSKRFDMGIVIVPKPNPNEVDEWKWIDIDILVKDMKINPDQYTAWFMIIMNNYYESLKKWKLQ